MKIYVQNCSLHRYRGHEATTIRSMRQQRDDQLASLPNTMNSAGLINPQHTSCPPAEILLPLLQSLEEPFDLRSLAFRLP